MALPIRWAPKAAHQLEAIVEYIAQDSERYAAIFARRVLQIVRTIPVHPAAGRAVPEYGNQKLRERIHIGYRIVYRLTPNTVEIVAICHGARLIEKAITVSKTSTDQ
jgi:plasmid stabilization system protein ParE